MVGFDLPLAFHLVPQCFKNSACKERDEGEESILGLIVHGNCIWSGSPAIDSMPTRNDDTASDRWMSGAPSEDASLTPPLNACTDGSFADLAKRRPPVPCVYQLCWTVCPRTKVC